MTWDGRQKEADHQASMGSGGILLALSELGAAGVIGGGKATMELQIPDIMSAFLITKTLQHVKSRRT